MLWIDEQTAADYLRDTNRIGRDEPVVVRELAGGVSNVVLLVARPDGTPRFVLKQAREQLRVSEPWFCSVTRVLREVEVLEQGRRALAAAKGGAGPVDEFEAVLPEVLFCDADNYLFAMTAAPPHEVWKKQLLAGRCDARVAHACGRLLGRLHGATWYDSETARRLADRTFFDQLRIDPYYRHVVRQRPPLAAPLERVITAVLAHRRCLVHGDFSPKNLLVSPRMLTLVDCEVGHFGDPAFDLGFFLSHLVLKAIHAGQAWWDYVRLTFAFWEAYESTARNVMGGEEYAAVVSRAIDNFAACCLARVDGKSPVEYLNAASRCRARDAAERLLYRPAATWPAAVAELVPFLSR